MSKGRGLGEGKRFARRHSVRVTRGCALGGRKCTDAMHMMPRSWHFLTFLDCRLPVTDMRHAHSTLRLGLRESFTAELSWFTQRAVRSSNSSHAKRSSGQPCGICHAMMCHAICHACRSCIALHCRCCWYPGAQHCCSIARMCAAGGAGPAPQALMLVGLWVAVVLQTGMCSLRGQCLASWHHGQHGPSACMFRQALTAGYISVHLGFWFSPFIICECTRQSAQK